MKQKGETLVKKGSALKDTAYQLEILSGSDVPSFGKRVKDVTGSSLQPKKLEILQVNLGYMCNMTCEHCHVDAGPDRKEITSKKILEACLKAIDLASIRTVDLTGGAPEMNPDFIWFVEELSKRKVNIIVRSNLTILVSNQKFKAYPAFFKKHKIKVVASLPCYTAENTDKQRGDGTFSDSIQALKILNELGYGVENSGLELNLVYNPGGPSLPPDQWKLEQDYKNNLSKDFGIVFNHLYTITNLPISRFLDYLMVLGRYKEYMQKLSDAFNPLSLENVMCTNTLSVDWNGDLFDCDFNQILGLKISGKCKNIESFNESVLSNREIVVHQHCYGCTAGAGSSCGGALV